MMDVAHLIQLSRKRLGMTQTALVLASGVSLPNLQKIEAGRGNPSIYTLEMLLSALGLRIETTYRKANWDVLAVCGAPLLAQSNLKILPNPDLLIQEIRIACVELHLGEDIADKSRKRESLQALLLALKAHYPSFFEKHFAKSDLIQSILKEPITGKIIKLKRQATASLSKFL